MKCLDHGHYRISDKLASKLAKENPHFGSKSLPKIGHERRVKHNDSYWWLSRTPYSVAIDAPKRGWVWCLHGESKT